MVQEILKQNLFDEATICAEREILIQIYKWDVIHEQVLRLKSRAT